MLYGKLPTDLGLIDLSPTEMMFWLYCPIMTPRRWVTLPPNLKHFKPIVEAALRHEDEVNYGAFEDGYVYLTAKTLWITEGCVGNRPGWHSDGFGTSDVNYIWYDRAPTEFLSLDEPVPLSEDCRQSMVEMEALAAGHEPVVFPDKHLLRLDPSVIHRSPVIFEAGLRTFVKVSLSNDRYDLAGNSINHALDLDWDLTPRKVERNHPASVHAG